MSVNREGKAHMDDPGDYDLRKSVQTTGPPPLFNRRLLLWFLTVAMLVALATAAVFFLRHEQPQPRPSVGSPPPRSEVLPAVAPLTSRRSKVSPHYRAADRH